MPLLSTSGGQIDLAALAGIAVVYCYPMTGRPGVAPHEEWTAIPGAAGCTLQSCAFRDSFGELRELGVYVFRVSVQTMEVQREATQRLNLPFELLSDSKLSFAQALNLPTFEAAGGRWIRRLTLIIAKGAVVKCFYPVFPPNRNASDVVAWLQLNQK